jgi:hypothetical protein
MGVFAALFLVVAAICGLLVAPVLFLYLYHTFPDTWWTEFVKIQALAGASVALFAASLGTIGVLLTIWYQKRNLEKQLRAQRSEQDRSRTIQRQHVASAFIGEIDVIVEELDHELVGPILKKSLLDIETSVGKVPVTTVRLTSNPRYYYNNPGNVGLFANRLSQELTRFYSRLDAFSGCLDRYSVAAEHGAAEGKLPATTSTEWVIYIIRDALRHLDFLLEHGRMLVTELEVIRDAKIDG